MKKLVTVCWSNTIEVDLPEDVGFTELDSFNPPVNVADIIRQAYDNISASDGMITDVQVE